MPTTANDPTQQLSSLKVKMSSELPHLDKLFSSRLSARAEADEHKVQVDRSTPPWHREVDYESAFRLLQRASEAIDALHERCRRLEADARDLHERTRNEAASSEQVIKDWERLATALKAHLAESDSARAETQIKLAATEDRATTLGELLKSAEDRASALEARAEAAEARAEAAEQRAAREIEIATAFRDAIVQTFGVGTRLSSALSGDHDT